MLEIRITAPEISEAINNLARAIGLAVTNPTGMTIGVTRSNTTCAAANGSVPVQVAEPTQTVANPAVPVSAPQTVPTAPSTRPVQYPTPTTANHTTSVPVTPTAPTASTIPTAAPQYTLDMIANAGTALVDAGKMSEVTALLAKYGVEALTALDPSYYGAFANELRSLGAQI